MYTVDTRHTAITWKALKGQTLGASVHVIALVCWLSCVVTFLLAMRILFCSCRCKVHSGISEALSQALYNLSLVCLADFTLSYSTALIHFIAFFHKLHSAFPLDQRTWSERSHVFCLTGTAALHCGHTFAYLLPMANNRSRNECLSQEQNGC